jgi:Na+-driven multidrug efflux pump
MVITLSYQIYIYIGNMICMFVLNMGVVGAAIGTVIARFFMLLLQLHFLRKQTEYNM